MREMKDSGIEWIGKVPVEWKIDNHSNPFLFLDKETLPLLGSNIVLQRILHHFYIEYSCHNFLFLLSLYSEVTSHNQLSHL